MIVSWKSCCTRGLSPKIQLVSYLSKMRGNTATPFWLSWKMRPLKLVALLAGMFMPLLMHAQAGAKKENRCLRFDGKGDHVDFGNIYQDLKLPFTISAWINLEPSNIDLAPVFANRNNISTYSGFVLIVDRNYMTLQYGDGFGMKHHAYRRGKEATIRLSHNEWHHVTAVVTDRDNIELYLDGRNVGGEMTGSSTQPMDSSNPTGFASAGYAISNNVEYRFKGSLDDIRLWNRALSPAEVEASLCNILTGKEPGLIGHWTFDEASGKVCDDKSPNNFDGKLAGNTKRERAGTPCVN